MHAVEVDGRLSLCPYYFLAAGQTRLSGVLANLDLPPPRAIKIKLRLPTP